MQAEPRRQAPLIAVAASIAFVAVYHGLFTGKWMFVHDTITWYGAFHFFVENLADGVIPYWDPYQLGGTPFYPYNSLFGNLDPLVLLLVLVRKLTGVSPLALYVAFRLLRLFVFVAGQFFLFRHLTKDAPASALASVILLFVFPLTYFRQFGAIDAVYLTPLAMFFLARFLEDPAGQRRAVFLASFALVTGISMGIYIPAFYLFNIIGFGLCLFLFKVTDLRKLRDALRDRRFAAFAAACLLAAGLMTAPSLAVMLKDASGDGELFPMQRIIQRNNGDFKQLVASDINTNNLSNRFTNLRALYNTWGELANLLFPDLVTFKYWQRHDLQSEIDHYIGVIPLVLAVFGFVRLRSPYRWPLLVMLALVFVNGFSLEGFGNKPMNLLQRFFAAVFPPLAMYQGKENLGYFVLMYLSAFAAMGLALLFRDAQALRTGARLIAGLAAGAVAVKLVIAALFADSFPATSAYDGFVLLQLVLLAAGVLLAAAGKLPHRTVVLSLAAVVLLDLVWYNENAKEYSLQDAEPYYRMVDEATARRNEEFQYFREPALQGLAFQESISREKGALSLGLNHSLFTTKRFYDLFTSVPLDTQYMINGMVTPLVRFFPEGSVVTVRDRRELLSLLSGAEPNDLRDRLMLEKGPADARGRSAMQEFDRYQNADWLRPQNLFGHCNRFLQANEHTVRELREGLRDLLATPGHRVAVRSFSVNEVVFEVRNAVAGHLYYGDGWSGHWKAFDNGRQVPLLAANYNAKAVFLDPGKHTVRFLFTPRHYQAGLAAYAMSLLWITGAIAYLGVRNSRTAAPASREDA